MISKETIKLTQDYRIQGIEILKGSKIVLRGPAAQTLIRRGVAELVKPRAKANADAVDRNKDNRADAATDYA